MALQRRGRDASSDGSVGDDAVVPGKETQVERLAAQGVTGPGGGLPFADAIAASFGSAHADTVQAIQAHTGSAATAASEGIGARAYATGNQVAFAGTPDLHTAAHEAAHVVQQRQGVHLKGGVGQAGDVYERHADAVADRVVQGQSAAELLGAPGTAAASAAVQRKGAPKPSKADEKKAHDQFESDGPMVVYALSGVFHESHAQMEYMPSKYVEAMNKLFIVKYGRGPSGHRPPTAGRERRAMLDQVWPIFEPFAQANAHFGADWDGLPTAMDNLRASVLASEASDRVDNAIVFGEGKDQKAMDMPDDSHPNEQAQALVGVIPKILEAVERAIAAAKKKGDAAVNKDQLAQLAATAELLRFSSSYLAMSDQDLHLHIDAVKAKVKDVTDKNSPIKKSLTMASYTMKGVLTIGEQLMKLVGDKMMAVECSTVAQGFGDAFGGVIAVVGIVHGISVLLDDNASTDDKIGAGVEIAGGAAFLVAGSAAAAAITGPFMLIKGAQYLYSEAVIGWETDLVRGAFQSMQRDAGMIGKSMERLAAAQIMQRDEQDPEKRTALGHEADNRLGALKSNLLSFLSSTEYRDHGSDIYEPGNIQIISDAFAAPRNHREGARSQAEITALSHEVSQQIGWCFKHGPAIVKATASKKDITEVDAMEDDLEKKAKKS